MLDAIVERLIGLLKQGRIEYADLEALTKECSSLTDDELAMFVTRLDAILRLVTALQKRRQAQQSQFKEAQPTKRRLKGGA